MEPLIRLEQDQCTDFGVAFGLEWLETNGIGGSACSTVSGANARRYHGLLATSPGPRGESFLLLSKLEESIVAGSAAWDLSTNRYRDVVYPRGYRLLREFSIDPFPTFVFAFDEFELEKTVLMVRGQNTTVVCYRLLSGEGPARLEVRPLVAGRGLLALTHENADLNPHYAEIDNRVVLRPYAGIPAFQLAHNGTGVRREGFWYRSFYYRGEGGQEPGEKEDLFNPCSLRFDLSIGKVSWIAASTRTLPVYDETVAGWIELESYRRRNFCFARGEGADSPQESALLKAADQFIVRGAGDRVGVLQSYPARREGGAGPVIALTGLSLVTGRWEEARRFLLTVSARRRHGLLLDHLPDDAETEVESDIETSLWFVHAVDRYLKYTGDLDTIGSDLFAAVKEIVRACESGIDPSVRMEPDGMLVTERSHAYSRRRGCAGKLVEIQALWYHALCVAAFLAQSLEGTRSARRYTGLARACRKSFLAAFWNSGASCLFDRLEDGGPDPAIGPHQILAAALPSSMLSRARQQAVVRQVRERILTPFGLKIGTATPQQLRSANPGNDAHSPGEVVEPWWIGPYVSAYLMAFGRTPKTRAHVTRLLKPLEQQLRKACLGTISGRFSARPPHEPCDPVADARTLGEYLRLYYEESRGQPARG